MRLRESSKRSRTGRIDLSKAVGALIAKMPAEVVVQLATLTKLAPEGDEWLHEMKFDGYRMICRLDRCRVRFISRNQKDWTVAGNGRAFLGEACRMGLEGIISKRRNRPYQPGRGDDWLKVKCVQTDEFVIGGYSEPSGARTG